jgi:hypothetical protein
MKSSLLTLALVIGLQAPVGTPLDQGRDLTSMLYQGKDAEVWNRFSEKMKGVIARVEDLAALRAKVAEQAGAEVAILDERVEEVRGLSVYVRTARFSKAPGPVIVQWALGAGGVVEGFNIRPAPQEAPTERLDYVTKTSLRLPFTGPWFVFWGGRTLKDNYHTIAVDQRFAYDIVMTREGSSHVKEGKTNDEYFCFGQEVLAPAAGTVVSVENAIDDNVPGVMNPTTPLGNHVIIDHGNGEFSFLAHFKKGTVAVKAGDVVKASDLVGRAGNSGNSSEPHLHFHLQDTGVFKAGRGLPAPFNDYIADGKPVTRGEPVKGQTVARVVG